MASSDERGSLDALERYVRAFSRLNRFANPAGHRAPHKPALLLAVLDLAEAGRLPRNEIEYGTELLERFVIYFRVVSRQGDRFTPYNPFGRLAREGFWHLEPNPGRGPVVASPKFTSHADVHRNVAFASLDAGLFDLIQRPATREALRRTIIERYFPDHARALGDVGRREHAANAYERVLEERVAGVARDAPAPELQARDAAFSRVVRSAYDHHCAACGLRMIADDTGHSLVEAAHLIPRPAGGDDPRNGIALCRNHHWAMDEFLIAPGPDMRWRVADFIDDRVDPACFLLPLRDRTVAGLRDKRYSPFAESLRWRVRQLRHPATPT
ncbi:MAG: HNH endonuclease [Acidobacteria bacterium]|nr:HNH endonuclease [Acidobacteriota bacterium]